MVIGVLAQYGPLPVGVIIGIWIHKWSVEQLIKNLEKQKADWDKQRNDHDKRMKTNYDRIEKLHDKLQLLQEGGKK